LPKRSNPPACKLGSRYVEWIHDDVIGSVWPSVDPVSKDEYRNVDLLESALARPFHSVGEQDAYPTVAEKATALFHSMIANHPFQNGNKRTAVVALDVFLVANGYAIAISNDKIYELATKTASYNERGITHERSFDEIKTTLNKYVVPLPLLYKEQKKDPKLVGFYKASITLRVSVRRNKHNQLMP